MPRPAGGGSASAALTEQQERARTFVREHPGKVVLALPQQKNQRRGTIKIYIFDDERHIFVRLAYWLFQVGIDINSMFAANRDEELWLEPVYASKLSDMESLLATEQALEMALFDIKLGQGSKSGLDLLVDARRKVDFEEIDAFLAPQSSVIQNMSEQQAFGAGDTGIMKDIPEKLRAYYLYEKALFGTSRLRPNPEWVQTCDTCELYEQPQAPADGMSPSGRCTAVRSSDPKLGFHPGTLCYWLNLPALEEAYEAVKARGGTGHFIGSQILVIKNYVGAKAASDRVRAAIEQTQRKRTRVSLGANRSFFDRSPMVLRPDQLIVLAPPLLENLGIPRLRDKRMIFPPERLQPMWGQLQKEFVEK